MLILHFSFHKCMTNYYKSVMSRIDGINYYHFGSSEKDFFKALNKGQLNAMSFNNHFVDLDQLREEFSFKASHFIRDPRDLCVSALKYHKRSDEDWLHILRPVTWYKALINLARPTGISMPVPNEAITFQDWLKSINNQVGLFYEICWREYAGHFAAMENWQYDDPNTLEFKYEEIFGNEVLVFKSLFEHYGLSDQQIDQGLRLAHKFTFAKRKKHNNQHIAKGAAGQWYNVFDNEAINLFNTLRPNLLEKVGYKT